MASPTGETIHVDWSQFRIYPSDPDHIPAGAFFRKFTPSGTVMASDGRDEPKILSVQCGSSDQAKSVIAGAVMDFANHSPPALLYDNHAYRIEGAGIGADVSSVNVLVYYNPHGQ